METTTAHLRLDTHRIIKGLEKRGFTEEQAEGVLQAIEEIELQGVVTKGDLASLEAVLKTDLNTVKTMLSGEISTLDKALRDEISTVQNDVQGVRENLNTFRVEIYKAMFYQVFAIVGLTVTFIKFLL